MSSSFRGVKCSMRSSPALKPITVPPSNPDTPRPPARAGLAAAALLAAIRGYKVSVSPYVAAGSAYLAPPLLLASDILLIQFISEPGLLVQRIALIVFMPAIAAVVVLAHHRARWQVGAGAAIAIVGALAIVIRQGLLAGQMTLLVV